MKQQIIKHLLIVLIITLISTINSYSQTKINDIPVIIKGIKLGTINQNIIPNKYTKTTLVATEGKIGVKLFDKKIERIVFMPDKNLSENRLQFIVSSLEKKFKIKFDTLNYEYTDSKLVLGYEDENAVIIIKTNTEWVNNGTFEYSTVIFFIDKKIQLLRAVQEQNDI